MKTYTLLSAFTGVAMLSLAAPAAAQTADTYPNRPIRIIVPQAAGSGVDLQARTLAQKMGELWGHQGVVENRPGANAIIGMEAVAKSAPDGYTLVYAPVSSITTNQFIYKKLPYDASATSRRSPRPSPTRWAPFPIRRRGSSRSRSLSNGPRPIPAA